MNGDGASSKWTDADSPVCASLVSVEKAGFLPYNENAGQALPSGLL
jgi:hypothetical protein